MERYLTGAAKKRAWWEIPTGALSAFVGAVAVDVLVEDLQKGLSDPVIELLAYGTVLALVLAPLYAVVRRALRRRWAQRIAHTLADSSAVHLKACFARASRSDTTAKFCTKRCA